MSAFIHSITFNDHTATTSFTTKLNSYNQVDWTLSLTSGINKVSTTGAVVLELSPPKTTPVVSTEPVTSWLGTVMPVDENTAKHVAFIKEALNTIETSIGRDAKAACAKMMFDYLTICGMDFIKAHERFKETVINKAYELKRQAPEKATMIGSINKVLTVLDQPLEKPFTLPPPPPDLTTTKDDTDEYNPFVETSKRMDYDYIKNSNEYYQRINLMKDLFTNNKLTFTPIVMTLYDEWQKTYKATGSSNRYKKMCVFIDAHKPLFTTA